MGLIIHRLVGFILVQRVLGCVLQLRPGSPGLQRLFCCFFLLQLGPGPDQLCFFLRLHQFDRGCPRQHFFRDGPDQLQRVRCLHQHQPGRPGREQLDRLGLRSNQLQRVVLQLGRPGFEQLDCLGLRPNQL